MTIGWPRDRLPLPLLSTEARRSRQPVSRLLQNVRCGAGVLMFPELFRRSPAQSVPRPDPGAGLLIAPDRPARGAPARPDPDRLVNVIVVVLILRAGARALYVIRARPEFRREWGGVLALWRGGLTLYGGIVPGPWRGVVGGVSRLRWTTADALVPLAGLGTALRAWVPFLNGCCYGRPTTLPWGCTSARLAAALEFSRVAVHPSQLISCGGVRLFGLTWWLRRRLTVPGTLF
jgi:hypothetical protein